MNNYENNIENLKLCSINDEQGSPTKEKYSFGEYSPTTLRYFKVSSDINYCFGDTSEMNIVEIGGGYGGQCMVHGAMFGFNSWTIVDLPEVIKLQKRYLHDKSNINYISCYDVTDNINCDLTISNYAFSEVIREYQDKYIDAYMSNKEKIYMTVNFIPQHNKIYETMYNKDELSNRLNLSIFNEVPNTHPQNAIVVRGNIKELPS
jgi:putative sugar O-methyltransferase